MGAGASSASPNDLLLLNQCLDSLKDRALPTEDVSSKKTAHALAADLRKEFLSEIPQERIASLLPVLEAAVEKYLVEHKSTLAHASACEAALVAARAVFSAGKPLPPVSSMATPSEQDSSSAPMLGSSKQNKSASELQTRRSRGRDAPAKPAAKVVLSGSRSCFEAAEIGGGTTYTTSLDLYENGECEFGCHDVGQRGRQVTRRAQRGQSFSEAFFWGGYEYYKGTWALAEPPETTEMGPGADGRHFRVTLTSVRAQPSDPYSSEHAEREVSGSFLVHETTVESQPGDSAKTNDSGEDSANAASEAPRKSKTTKHFGLVLSEFEGEPHSGTVKFKELQLSAGGEGMDSLAIEGGESRIEGCEGVMGSTLVRTEFRMEQEEAAKA